MFVHSNKRENLPFLFRSNRFRGRGVGFADALWLGKSGDYKALEIKGTRIHLCTKHKWRRPISSVSGEIAATQI